jgi:hypothetical protein
LSFPAWLGIQRKGHLFVIPDLIGNPEKGTPLCHSRLDRGPLCHSQLDWESREGNTPPSFWTERSPTLSFWTERSPTLSFWTERSGVKNLMVSAKVMRFFASLRMTGGC